MQSETTSRKKIREDGKYYVCVCVCVFIMEKGRKNAKIEEKWKEKGVCVCLYVFHLLKFSFPEKQYGPEHHDAATKLQANFKGYKVRDQLEKDVDCWEGGKKKGGGDWKKRTQLSCFVVVLCMWKILAAFGKSIECD